ncbi:hypothetical protein WISP_50220 [Willisornis vidua]|uniref:Uncharacterized protein n=1 Tax=Willisornis vidua TaxID=1566151 RepID=A0ABQ9DEK1_9PASS|nr:hypothetical protein WISP_50220 [Willisornis vidua]
MPMHPSSLDSYHASAICILIKSYSGAHSLHLVNHGNSSKDLKFDLNKTSVINLLDDLVRYLHYLYIETKELRMVMMNGENMGIGCGAKLERDLYMGPEY